MSTSPGPSCRSPSQLRPPIEALARRCVAMDHVAELRLQCADLARARSVAFFLIYGRTPRSTMRFPSRAHVECAAVRLPPSYDRRSCRVGPGWSPGSFLELPHRGTMPEADLATGRRRSAEAG